MTVKVNIMQIEKKKANRKEHTNHKKWHKEQGNIINIVAIWNAVLPALQRV